MAINTGNTKFRKVNVDQYCEDVFEEDSIQNGTDERLPNETEITELLAQGKNLEAIKIILNNPPLKTKNQVIKDKILQLAIKVLLSFKNSEIEGVIKQLSSQDIDTLMKYIYRGFENPSDGSSAQLLSWHEKAYATGGMGSIVRVLTDRRKV